MTRSWSTIAALVGFVAITAACGKTESHTFAPSLADQTSAAPVSQAPARPALAGPAEDPAATRDYWTEERLAVAGHRDPDPRSADSSGGIPDNLRRTPGADQYGLAPWPQSFADDSRSKATGMLVFHDPKDDDDTHCSASVLATKSHRVVVTAAHCVSKGSESRWYDHVAFVPAAGAVDSAQARPYGIWPVEQTWIPGDWFNPNSTATTDLALLVLAAGPDGKNVQDVVGGLEPRINHAGESFHDLTTLGYPAEPPYSGDVLQRCDGDGTDDPTFPGMIFTVNCAPLGGASGGPATIPDPDRPGSFFVLGVLSTGTAPPKDAAFARLSPEIYGPLIEKVD
ncbi:trypsin-like serine peptidase [Nocardia sp. NPDC051570]|uniref:trypsin-like serine peptidase n=1 Tax=Nocardia sp. NPDC051570 TaxID=3364324 RepID=UPI00378B069D